MNSIEDEIKAFLVEVGEISKHEKIDIVAKDSSGNLFVINLLDNTDFDLTQEGIYKFVIFSGHSRPFLFLYENKQINIIRDYSVSNILRVLTQFFESKGSTLNQKAKIRYLENVVSVIKENQNPPGSIELPDNFQMPDSLKQ